LGQIGGKRPFFPDLDDMLKMAPISDVDAGRSCWPVLRAWLIEELFDPADVAWVRQHQP
jgi:hypothetical protein